MKVKEQTRQDLDKAVQILDRRGWCKGEYGSADGRVCTAGAVVAAISGVEDLHATAPWHRDHGDSIRDSIRVDLTLKSSRMARALAALSYAVPAEYTVPENSTCAISYNDDEGTSVEDVKLMFKRAIEAQD